MSCSVQAAQAVLAAPFRALMADNRELAPIAQEVELCRQYLELEQLRLGARLQVEWHTGNMPDDALVPPLETDQGAGVERDPFADQHDRLALFRGTPVLEHDELGRPRAALRDREHRAVAQMDVPIVGTQDREGFQAGSARGRAHRCSRNQSRAAALARGKASR